MKCPVCGSQYTDYGILQFDDVDEPYREWDCNECLSKWVETGDYEVYWNGRAIEIQRHPDADNFIALRTEKQLWDEARRRMIPMFGKE